MGPIVTLALKDLRLLVRDKVGCFFTFFFPLVFAIFFGVLYSGGADRGPSSIGVVVVDADQTPESAAFIERLAADDTLEIEHADNREIAADLVRRGERTAYLIVPAGFGAASQQIFWGNPMRIELGIDPARSMQGGLLQGLVTARAFEQMQRLFTDPTAMRSQIQQSRELLTGAEDSENGLSGLQRTLLSTLLGSVDTFYATLEEDPQTPVDPPTTQSAETGAPARGWQPIEVTTTEVATQSERRRGEPTSSFAICFPQGIIWGVMACAATFAASLLIERTRGTLPRLLAAPLSRWQVLAGKGLACFITTAALIAVMLLIAAIVFGVRPTSLPLLILAIVCVSIGIIGIMMVFSVLGKTEAAVSGISWAVIIVMAMIGGGMIPLFMMPAWMQTLSNFSIIKWAILALEGAIWRDFSFAEMLIPCGVLMAIGVIGFGIGATVFRWGEQH